MDFAASTSRFEERIQVERPTTIYFVCLRTQCESCNAFVVLRYVFQRSFELAATIMLFHSALVLLSSFAHGSFYDNPELDPIPETGSPLDDLKAKWDAEVGFSVSDSLTRG